MKPVKVIAGACALLLLLALLLISAANFLVDPDQYKLLLEKTAAENGVSLKIAGNLHWSLVPVIGFSAADIQLQSPHNNEKEVKNIHFDKVSLSLDLYQLLHGNLHIKALSLDNILFSTNDAPTIQFNRAILKLSDANNRGEDFPVDLTLDDTRIAGKIAINTTDTLRLRIDLHGDTINLDRYSQPEKTPTNVEPDNKKNHGNKQKSEKADQDETLPLASLLQALGSYRIRFDHITTDHLELQNVVFDATVEDKQVTLNAFDAELYQGKLSTKGIIDLTSGQDPKIKIEALIDKVGIAPLLTDLLQEKPALTAGSLNLTANIHGKGSTRKKIMQTLSGTASANFENLILHGTNLEQLTCEAASLAQNLTGDKTQWPEDTLIRNLHVESRIVNGIVFIAPLTAKMDTLTINGSGPVNLLSEMLDIRLDITAHTENQSAHSCSAFNSAVSGVAMPIRCEGNYRVSPENLCGVDKSEIGKLISQIAIKNLEQGKGSLKERLRNLFH